MSARVTEARRLLRDAQIPAGGKPIYTSDADAIAAAQVLATLELAEQQRIANLIAYTQAEKGPYRYINDIPDLIPAVIGQIKKGLKL